MLIRYPAPFRSLKISTCAVDSWTATPEGDNSRKGTTYTSDYSSTDSRRVPNRYVWCVCLSGHVSRDAIWVLGVVKIGPWR